MSFFLSIENCGFFWQTSQFLTKASFKTLSQTSRSDPYYLEILLYIVDNLNFMYCAGRTIEANYTIFKDKNLIISSKLTSSFLSNFKM